MKYILGLLIIVALVLAGFFISGKSSGRQDTSSTSTDTPPSSAAIIPTGVEHRVVLTADGYEPSELTIHAGDTIIFSADAAYGRPHWPASNVHPTHSVYSAFDPKEPVDSGATWSFVFGDVGEWKFHDHLAPYHTGIISVEE